MKKPQKHNNEEKNEGVTRDKEGDNNCWFGSGTLFPLAICAAGLCVRACVFLHTTTTSSVATSHTTIRSKKQRLVSCSEEKQTFRLTAVLLPFLKSSSLHFSWLVRYASVVNVSTPTLRQKPLRRYDKSHRRA